MPLHRQHHGGQPMQIYYMHRDGISAGSSMITLLINISCVLFVTISLSLFYLLFNYQYMTPGLVVFFIFGTVINAAAIVLFLIAIFSEKTLDKIIKFVTRLIKNHYTKKIARIKKLHLNIEEALIKKAEDKSERRTTWLAEQSNKYKEDANIIRQNKAIIIKTLLIYYFQYTIFYIISYFSYRAVGLNEHNWFEVSSLQSIVYATVSGIPSPGAVGVSEAAYIGLFKNVIPEHLISSVMLLVRSLTFYLFVAIAGIVVIITAITTKKREIN